MFWTFEIAWKATLLLGLVLAADFVLRRASAAVRDVLWTIAFVTVLALPLASLWAPDWSAPVEASFTAASGSLASAGAQAANWAFWIGARRAPWPAAS